jgi:hypothetical protein
MFSEVEKAEDAGSPLVEMFSEVEKAEEHRRLGMDQRNCPRAAYIPPAHPSLAASPTRQPPR